MRTQQNPDLPIGKILESTAAIYFDFNPPIYTNTTWHTIAKDFIQVLNDVVENGGLAQPKVFPNPMGGTALFEFPVILPYNGEFQLLDATGKLLRKERIAGQHYQFERQDLAAGLYFYKITKNWAPSYSGKILIRSLIPFLR